MNPAPLRTPVARTLLGLCLGAGCAPVFAVTTHTPTLSRDEQAFVAKATADDSMQIAVAQAAWERSSSPQVRALARRIIDDHNALNAKFTKVSVARKAHGSAHGVSNRQVTEDTLHLRKLQGPALDQAFARMMVEEHRRIIPLYERAADDPGNRQLQQIARDALPLLRQHLQGAQALLDR
ncbi:DUF4142 domain-containing protein [Fulvimonas yonginensis]|uniref:DUF4142 domain-containing protein n=1 Tax=Fulvimonas yonginensis TaxID=1495200 RepID=A0ABU8JDK9_9GAMM